MPRDVSWDTKRVSQDTCLPSAGTHLLYSDMLHHVLQLHNKLQVLELAQAREQAWWGSGREVGVGENWTLNLRN